MSMLLIRGSFRVNGGAKPDGDTLPFIPEDPGDWKLVGGRAPIVPKADGRAGVRLEGVDTLETHYSNGSYGPERHQPLKFAHRAADELLTWLGFTHIERHADETVTTTPDSVPGFILTRGADAYGRCIALVGRGFPPGCSGYEIRVGEDLLRKTVNHHLLAVGLAYPTFYSGLPSDLRGVLKAAALQAREAVPPKGLWAEDVTVEGVKVTDMCAITADAGAVILPKLFRRLKDYLDYDPANQSLAWFPAFLAGAGDKFRILPGNDEVTGMHRLIEITDGQTLRMTHPCEQIVFDDK
ncbi:nuclease [Streptomyces sp. NPDC005409]|uniref:thermonuclease family protein n=1 Tax=Streptomyces sp. NPDC005409 TaxID=3155342 RepID=UPI003452E0B6